MSIPAIETSYAGHRFRSRLEARWAVFFDQLGIKWAYEPQGYLIGERKRPYLPDFRLPHLGVWAEVKGSPAELDLHLLDDAVSPQHGLPGSSPFGELSVLVLGEIPPPDAAYLHYVVSRTVYAPCEKFCACRDLRFSQVTFVPVKLPEDSPIQPGVILSQIGQSMTRPLFEDIVTPRPSAIVVPQGKVLLALRAARSAREPGTEWDGIETAQAWFDRIEERATDAQMPPGEPRIAGERPGACGAGPAIGAAKPHVTLEAPAYLPPDPPQDAA